MRFFADYAPADDCQNDDVYCICLKCGKCGRKFGEHGILDETDQWENLVKTLLEGEEVDNEEN